MKTLGKIALAVLGLLVAAVWLVILRLKDVPPVALVTYGAVLVAFLGGVLWPGRLGRRRALLFLGVPAGLGTLALYFAVVFYVTDAPVLLGAVAVACLLAALAGAVRRGRGGAGPSRRALLTGGAGILLGALAGLSTGPVARHRSEIEARWRRETQAALRAPGARRPVADGRVRVFPLHVGDTVVPYGQFYGGLDGWEGLPGYVRTLVDKAQITVPVHAYLIDHPRHGLMLVDTGVNGAQAHDHDGYYRHNLASRLLTERNEYQLTPEQDLRVRVARLGYDLKDVTTVFLTHVHEDHAGGLRHLAHARVVLDRRDWEQGTLYAHTFGEVRDALVFPAYGSGPFHAFPESHDHFGDGSVVLLPTPGHSPGHLCVALRMDGGTALFLGDTLYTLPHLAVGQVRQMTVGGQATADQLEAAERVRRTLAADPAMAPLFAHDNTAYQTEAVATAFREGLPEADGFRRLRDHLGGVLTADWRLRPGHAPAFAPGEGVGRVEFR
ncbi:N-acyl homoserine lactonase family protein [Nonomuraea harbinensis]|uniref:MBL fold metallo-hydrolase n=1 Tax=Nonomuraea harbinensis TaxID=1286938 RepID=A0ABW1BM04_9ACTN|nr:N-acyl homoserine lactonase family protein [Nonomuraea harbinensis]